MNESSDNIEAEVQHRKPPKSGGRTINRGRNDLDQAVLDQVIPENIV